MYMWSCKIIFLLFILFIIILQRPYTGKSRKKIKDKIMAKQVQIKKNEIPEGWSTEAADFVNRVNNIYNKFLYLSSYFKENLRIDQDLEELKK